MRARPEPFTRVLQDAVFHLNLTAYIVVLVLEATILDKIIGTLAHIAIFLVIHFPSLPPPHLSMLYFCERNEQTAPHMLANPNIDYRSGEC